MLLGNIAYDKHAPQMGKLPLDWAGLEMDSVALGFPEYTLVIRTWSLRGPWKLCLGWVLLQEVLALWGTRDFLKPWHFLHLPKVELVWAVTCGWWREWFLMWTPAGQEYPAWPCRQAGVLVHILLSRLAPSGAHGSLRVWMCGCTYSINSNAICKLLNVHKLL